MLNHLKLLQSYFDPREVLQSNMVHSKLNVTLLRGSIKTNVYSLMCDPPIESYYRITCARYNQFAESLRFFD